ncbi:MAG: hypothetical protein RSF67_02930 [Clostridia bacterium]
MNKNIKVNFSLIVCIDGDYLNNNSDYEQIFFSNKDIEIFKINTFLDDEYQQLSCKKIYNILENKIINQRNFIILINNKDVVSDEIKISKNHLSDNINLSISFLYDDICNKINELIKNLNLKSVLEDFKSNNDYYSSTNLFINYCNHRIQYHSILGFKVLYSKILEKKKIVNSDYFIDFLRNDYIKLNKNIFSSTE